MWCKDHVSCTTPPVQIVLTTALHGLNPFSRETHISQSATKYYAYNTENVLKIPFKKNCQTISKLDFQFKDELNAVIVPTRGLVKVKFEL